MKDEELKTIWKASNERIEEINLNNLNLNDMNQAIKKFEQRITKRNNLEIAVAIGSIALFIVFAYIKVEPMAKLGAILLVLYAANVIYQLRKTESKQPTFDMTQSLKLQLIDYQNYIKAERKLLKNIAYWYLLPMLPGMVLFLIGTGSTPIYVIIYFVVVIIMFTGIYLLNQKAVRGNMDPLIEDINKALATLEEK